MDQKAGRPGLGDTGEAVRSNIRRIRDEVLRIPVTELSRRLGELERPIPPLGLRRIEDGTRRVDTDDLTAIAVALGVSPATLLMPHANVDGVEAQSPDDLTQPITGLSEPITALRMWDWIGGESPLPGDADVLGFLSRARPRWKQLDERHQSILFPGES